MVIIRNLHFYVSIFEYLIMITITHVEILLSLHICYNAFYQPNIDNFASICHKPCYIKWPRFVQTCCRRGLLFLRILMLHLICILTSVNKSLQNLLKLIAARILILNKYNVSEVTKWEILYNSSYILHKLLYYRH